MVKKRFADAIRSGEKTLEIRSGPRYRNIWPGDTVSINGSFRRSVRSVERHELLSTLLRSLGGRHSQAGFRDAADADAAIRSCYSTSGGAIFYILHLEPER